MAKKIMSKELLNSASPISIESIYAAIRDNGFSEQTTQLIDNFTNDILNGKTNLTQFNQAEHAGLCTAGAPLIGAYTVCCYARASFEPSRFSSKGQTSSPSNWEIDAKQEEVLQQWAEAQKLWIPESEQWIISTFGPKIAQGAEAKGFRDNKEGEGVNYIGDRLYLEDMHPANVFINALTD